MFSIDVIVQLVAVCRIACQHFAARAVGRSSRDATASFEGGLQANSDVFDKRHHLSRTRILLMQCKTSKRSCARTHAYSPWPRPKKQKRSLVDMDVPSSLASNMHEIYEMHSLYNHSESALSLSRLQNTAPLYSQMLVQARWTDNPSTVG